MQQQFLLSALMAGAAAGIHLGIPPPAMQWAMVPITGVAPPAAPRVQAKGPPRTTKKTRSLITSLKRRPGGNSSNGTKQCGVKKRQYTEAQLKDALLAMYNPFDQQEGCIHWTRSAVKLKHPFITDHALKKYGLSVRDKVQAFWSGEVDGGPWGRGVTQGNAEQKGRLHKVVQSHIQKIEFASMLSGVCADRRIFTDAEELFLVENLKFQHRMGFGLSEKQVRIAPLPHTSRQHTCVYVCMLPPPPTSPYHHPSWSPASCGLCSSWRGGFKSASRSRGSAPCVRAACSCLYGSARGGSAKLVIESSTLSHCLTLSPLPPPVPLSCTPPPPTRPFSLRWDRAVLKWRSGAARCSQQSATWLGLTTCVAAILSMGFTSGTRLWVA